MQGIKQNMPKSKEKQMEYERKWFRELKRQRFEWKVEKILSQWDRFIDIDPRLSFGNIYRLNILKGINHLFKLAIKEITFEFYKHTIGKNKYLIEPIFMVGLPHSGTTISMELLAKHPDISNSSELNTYWHPRNYLDLKNADHVKEKRDFTAKEQHRLHSRLEFERFLHGNKKRFMNKNPNNLVTVEFIKSCFPDCYIIHIIRDGRAVVSSLLNGLPDYIEKYDRYKKPENRINPWPGVRPPGWKDKLNKDPIIQHSIQWVESLNYIDNKKEMLEPKYIEIKYEDLCNCTKDVIKSTWKKIGLDVKSKYLEEIPKQLQNKNFKYKKYLDKNDISKMEKIMYNKLKKYGYI